MTFKYRYRKQIAIGIILTVLIGLSSYGIYKYLPKKNTKKKDLVLTTTKKISTTKKILKDKNEQNKEVKKIIIDIKGNIVNPGIYELEEGKRVIDAIKAAGGLTESADTSVLNLSKKLKDEMVIIVYSYEDVLNFTIVKEQEQIKQEECIKGINDIGNDACIEESDISVNNNSKVSINTATLEELMTLEGIGESKAKSIIEYREKNGDFKVIEDILNVSGIGEGLFAKIKENITV